MTASESASPAAPSTRSMFLDGRSCGECLLETADLPDSPARDAMLRAVRGLSGGRGGTCTLLLAGLLALAERYPDADSQPRPANDLLDTFVPAGAPGSDAVRLSQAITEFKSRFETRANRDHGGITCSAISKLDWEAGGRASLPSGYPPDECVALADAALADLNELLAAAPGGS